MPHTVKGIAAATVLLAGFTTVSAQSRDADVIAFFRAYDDAFNAKDLQKLAALYHPDVTIFEGLAAALIVAIGARSLVAHVMTVMGTVVKIEATRIQVKTGKEKPGAVPSWYPIDGKTTIRRGTKVLSFRDAKIKANERVVLLLDHPAKGPVKTKEIRLPGQ